MKFGPSCIQCPCQALAMHAFGGQVTPTAKGAPWITARACLSCHFLPPDRILCLGGDFAPSAGGSRRVIQRGSAVLITIAPSPTIDLLEEHHVIEVEEAFDRRRQSPPAGELCSPLNGHNIDASPKAIKCSPRCARDMPSCTVRHRRA